MYIQTFFFAEQSTDTAEQSTDTAEQSTDTAEQSTDTAETQHGHSTEGSCVTV